MMAQQLELEDKCEGLMTKRSNLVGLTNKSKYIETQQTISTIITGLRDNTQKICRTLKENPNIPKNIRKASNERNLLLQLLNKIITDLNSGHYVSLHQQVEAELAERSKQYEFEQRKTIALAGIEHLEEQLSKERLQLMKASKEKADQIESLKTELKV